MPLARLENFLKNLSGNTLYVDPNDLDATDSIENRGNSKLRPFKTIQRALLEAARFSYVAGSNNDIFDQTTILISPGTHYIDNRPGYYLTSSNVIKDAGNFTKTIAEFNILSNFDITDPENELYIYNSVNGGVVLPKGTSLVATDLRKTKIRPLYIPDPTNSTIESSAIFRLTGSCYFFGFTIYDGDPSGKVYNTYGPNTVSPFYSHHKLTAFEYADGVNDVVKNNTNTGRTDLETYYYKVALAYGQQSSRDIVNGDNNFQPNIDEFRIVGELGIGSVGISSIRSGDGISATTAITVTTETEHKLSPFTPILISGVGDAEGAPTTTEYNGNFIVAQVLTEKQFVYVLPQVPTGSLLPSFNGAAVKVISDTTTSSSPYVFNCSLKSVYGMNGLHADGSKATGFRSMVTAQFTGISLQKDDRAFVKYDEDLGSYQDQTAFGTDEFLHQNINSIYKPDWSSFHIKASNDAFIQCVSIFAIGYANQFTADSGGDQSITNSNSNFGQRALFSEGFKQDAFPKDDHGFITHVIPPKDISVEVSNINVYLTNKDLPNTNSRLYLQGFKDILTPPPDKIRGYSVGGKFEDKIYYIYNGVEYYANITPSYQIRTGITTIDTSLNTLTLDSISGISTGLAVRILSNDAVLPDGIEHSQTYFAKFVGGNNIRIYENLENCNGDIANTGSTAVDIKNTVGLSTNNLFVVSKVSDRSSGSVGSPIQWDSANKNWYVGITTVPESANFISNIANLTSTPQLFIKRVIDTRSKPDRAYRLRYVIPKESNAAAVPTTGFVIQKSSYPLNSSYPIGVSSTSSSVELTAGANNSDILSTIRNKNVIVDAWYSSGTVTIITKNPHNLKVGNKIKIFNLKSSNEPNPIGIGTGTGYNGKFAVATVPNDLTFTYSISVNPGTITAGVSTITSWLNERDCTQVSRVPPYTIYQNNRANLPYFVCNQIENHYQAYNIKQIQKYVEGSTDGIYHITLDAYKNTPTISPYNITQYKFGQSLDNLYPKIDFDNFNADPEATVTVASRQVLGSVDVNDPYLSSTKEMMVGFFKDFDIGKSITGFVQAGNNTTITTSQNHGLAGIKKVVALSLGSGYTNGTFYDIPLCGGSGQNATVNVQVAGGVPTFFEIANPGSGYLLNETLSVKGIPGSTTATTVAVNSLNFNPADSDLIQILGATNSVNNGAFIISSVTTNTITYSNPSGVTEATTNATVILSGAGYSLQSVSYDASSGISTVYTGTLSPHNFVLGNKVLFDVNGLGICTVTGTVGSASTAFTINGNASTATRVYAVGLVPTLKDTNSLNENLNTRNYIYHIDYKGRLTTPMTVTSTATNLNNTNGLRKGDFIQVEDEIMLITKIDVSNSITVKRGLFATQAREHLINSSVEGVGVIPVELRRPSILRASGQTFEYTGFGPGNYSTAMPSNQTKVLSDKQVLNSQALPNRGGYVVYSGMNSNGEFFIGRKKFDAASGEEIVDPGEGDVAIISDFDSLTLNKLTVNKEIDASTAFVKIKELQVLGISTHLGISTFREGIWVTGISTFNNPVAISSTLTITGNVTVGAGASFIGSGITPIGGIIMWNGTLAQASDLEPDWALCDGRTVNGRTTPDLRNRFVIGASADSGGTAQTGITGSNTQTGGTKDAVIVDHTHNISGNASITVVTSVSEEPVNQGNGGSVQVGDGGNETTAVLSISAANSGVSGTDQNLPPYYALAFIMRTR